MSEDNAASNSSEDFDELVNLVASGQATDEQYDLFAAKYVSADAQNQLAAMFRSPEAQEAAFRDWYDNVIAPIGLPEEPARQMFNGEMDISDFVDSLTDEQMDAFLDKYPALQEAYNAKLDETG